MAKDQQVERGDAFMRRRRTSRGRRRRRSGSGGYGARSASSEHGGRQRNWWVNMGVGTVCSSDGRIYAGTGGGTGEQEFEETRGAGCKSSFTERRVLDLDGSQIERKKQEKREELRGPECKKKRGGRDLAEREERHSLSFIRRWGRFRTSPGGGYL
jgi:hypothetical protein